MKQELFSTKCHLTSCRMKKEKNALHYGFGYFDDVEKMLFIIWKRLKKITFRVLFYYLQWNIARSSCCLHFDGAGKKTKPKPKRSGSTVHFHHSFCFEANERFQTNRQPNTRKIKSYVHREREHELYKRGNTIIIRMAQNGVHSIWLHLRAVPQKIK